MVSACVLVFITVLAGTRSSSRRKKSRARDTPPTPESEDTVDWEKLSKEDDDEFDRSDVIDKRSLEVPTKVVQYTRRRTSKWSGIHLGEPSLPIDSPWIEGRSSPSESTLPTSPSREDTCEDDMDMLSLQHEQQLLTLNQEKMADDTRRLSAEFEKMKKECSKMSRKLKGVMTKLKLQCSSSDSSEDSE